MIMWSTHLNAVFSLFSYAKFLMDTVRHLLDIPVQFVVGSLCRLPSQLAKDFYGWDQLPQEMANNIKLCDVYVGDVFIAQGVAATTLGAKEAAARQVKTIVANHFFGRLRYSLSPFVTKLNTAYSLY